MLPICNRHSCKSAILGEATGELAQGLEIIGTLYQGSLRRASGRPANSLRSNSAGRFASRAPKRPYDISCK